MKAVGKKMKCGGVPRRTTTIATLDQSPGQFLLFF